MKNLFYSTWLCFILILASAPIRAQITSEENCLKCHFQGQTDKLTHTPAAENLCDMCHEKNATHYSTNYSKEVCSDCHDIQHDFPFKHKALDLKKECSSCHNPHGSEHQSYLKAPVNTLCTSCHSKVKHKDAKSTHDVAYVEDGCLNCHRPHGSVNKKLLTVPKEDLCLSCHNKEQDYLGKYPTSSKVVRNIQEVIDTSNFTHAPAKEKQCTVCHESHQSDQWWLLKGDSNPDPRNVASKNWNLLEDKYKTCFKCHDINMLNEKISTTETRFRNDQKIKKPWYLGGGNKIVRENLHRRHGMACGMCHDMHGTKLEHLIKRKWRPIPNGGTCGGGCHGDLDRWEFGVIYKRLD